MSWLVPPSIKKESKWKFNTFGTLGGGAGFVAASGGNIVLDDPNGKSVDFWYGGISGGLRTPSIKLGKFKVELPGSPTVAPTFFPSTGVVYVLDNLEQDELSELDIQGPCAFFEAGAGLVVGASGTAMYVGLNPWYIPFLANPNPLYNQAFINSSKGLLFMAGVSAGQLGAGASALIGYLR